MTPSRPERRRFARVNLTPPPSVGVTVSFPAQVIEISVSGVLLGSKCEVTPGTRAALRTTVGAQPLDVVVEIRDVSMVEQAQGGGQYRIGAAFVDMTAEQRARLLELLGVERN